MTSSVGKGGIPSVNRQYRIPIAWLNLGLPTHNARAVSAFSEDGQWWWDGHQWMASSQVVIPDLLAAQPETVQGSMQKRHELGEATTAVDWLGISSTPLSAAGFFVGLSFLFVERDAFRKFRQWTLDQLTSATAYLLGPDEPMVSGETTLYRPPSFLTVQAPVRDLAVVVTAAHVLVLRFDRPNGQPRWIALAARARDVQISASGEFLRARPTIVVRHGSQSWTIQGMARVMQLVPIVAAWKAALVAPVKT